MEQIGSFIRDLFRIIRSKFTAATAETISWIGLVLVHAATIPTVVTLMSGLNDRPPPVDIILFVWGGLALFFIKAAILKDMINLITIGVGFIIHAVMLALLIFK